MNIIDIVVLALLILLLLIGFFKGFLNTMLKFISTLLSFAAAIYLARPVTALLNNWFGVVNKFSTMFAQKFSEMFVPFTNVSGEIIKAEHINATGILKKALSLFIDNSTIYESDTALVQTLANNAASMFVIAIITIVLLVLIKLVIYLLAKLFDALKNRSAAFSGLDRILGGVFGLAKGLLIIAIVFVIANLLQPIPEVASALETVFKGSSIAKPMYDYITTLANTYIETIDFNSIFSAVIK